MRSMERLYAVPSEKLRVWMVWLANIGEIADEWHKWLRTYIDLIMRIAERLQMAAEDVPEERKIESTVSSNVTPLHQALERNVSNQILCYVTFPVTLKYIRLVYNQLSLRTKPWHKTSYHEEARLVVPIARYRPGLSAIYYSYSSLVFCVTSTGQPTSSNRGVTRPEGPQELELPKDEQEIIEILKNLTHQATLYRSYYKHWKNIADQAEKETAHRKVIPTARFLGILDDESPMNAAASQTAQYSMRQAESAVAQPTEEPMPATLMPTSSGIDSSTDAPGQEIIEEAIGGLFAIELDEPETMPTTVTVESNNLMPLLKIISTSPAVCKRFYVKMITPDVSRPVGRSTAAIENVTRNVCEPRRFCDATPQGQFSDSLPSTLTFAIHRKWRIVSIVRIENDRPDRFIIVYAYIVTQEAAAKREAAGKLVMDMAGADRNGPYFFYLRTEPDIDIAIEHNDEKVIPDPGRERISANRKYLYFNLRDEQR
ncbi:uncharacterized protein LOC113563220 [Ooceraea biroi]|uniref:uncharacterized protein LOC113563220 n=1 Tax=Ooceraea biroi TaxID=2015173 RepID=UPI000F091A82|nr:uncharacterized protein LOC113563220 [Ooceraea biroi]